MSSTSAVMSQNKSFDVIVDDVTGIHYKRIPAGSILRKGEAISKDSIITKFGDVYSIHGGRAYGETILDWPISLDFNEWRVSPRPSLADKGFDFDNFRASLDAGYTNPIPHHVFLNVDYCVTAVILIPIESNLSTLSLMSYFNFSGSVNLFVDFIRGNSSLSTYSICRLLSESNDLKYSQAIIDNSSIGNNSINEILLRLFLSKSYNFGHYMNLLKRAEIGEKDIENMISSLVHDQDNEMLKIFIDLFSREKVKSVILKKDIYSDLTPEMKIVLGGETTYSREISSDEEDETIISLIKKAVSEKNDTVFEFFFSHYGKEQLLELSKKAVFADEMTPKMRKLLTIKENGDECIECQA